MYQVQTLVADSWIAIDRAKRGKSSHKAYLTKEGVKIIQARKKDFEILNFYKEINQFIKETSQKIHGQPNLSSHSFRKGFIRLLPPYT